LFSSLARAPRPKAGSQIIEARGGLWERFRPITIQEFVADDNAKRVYWERKRELYGQLEHAQPNIAHRVIAKLKTRGKVKGVITQNIDGLHQAAGLPPDQVIELHGTNRETICLDCDTTTSWQDPYDQLLSGIAIPRCARCKGYLKPATISFGQGLDTDTLNRAIKWSQQCDLYIVVGSTLVVEPAASLPSMAKQYGAKLVINNMSLTPLDAFADLLLQTQAGEVFAELDRLIFADQ